MPIILQAFCTIILVYGIATAQQADHFQHFRFLSGQWQGTGNGFGNEASTIESSFEFVMDDTYIQVRNDSRFEPTDDKPEGDSHSDWGMISFDKKMKCIRYRQFNSEGYVNRYLLNDSLSTADKFVFETDFIENFVTGGRARWTINKIAEDEIETVFDVSFPGKEFACMGKNRLTRKK